MKQNRIVSLLLAAVLLLGTLCAGCAKKPADTEATHAPTAEAEPLPTEAPTAEITPETPEPEEVNDVPVRWQDGGKRSFLPHEPLSVPDLCDMVYERPETETLIADIEALTDRIPVCDDTEALLSDYYAVAERIEHLAAMDSLAFFRYSMDMSDSYFSDEYDYCEEQCTIVAEKENALNAAFAASPCRDALEQAYFGEGFFRDYDDFTEGDQAYFDLKQQENDLLFKYYKLASTADYTVYNGIRQNHEASGEIFIELVKVRRKIAEAKGYENYMDYSYACDYKRDYTTDRAREYLNGVRTLLAPLTQYDTVTGYDSEYGFWNESKAMEYLGSAAEKMGGPILEAFRFMTGHALYDISDAPNKMATAYTTYLNDYESPFVFVNPDAKDLLIALFHEYGHFTDFYRNYGALADYETGETYSQAMVYLAFAYADPFNDTQRQKNLRATVSQLLVYSILQEGAYADFELQVYALAPEELTVENLDAIFGQCMKDYGLARLNDVRFNSNYWSVYLHFFAYPGYVISYSDSAVAALQICRLEAENPGAGVDAFCRILDRTHGKKFAAILNETGLDSPFEEDTLQKSAAFLKDTFGIN